MFWLPPFDRVDPAGGAMQGNHTIKKGWPSSRVNCWFLIYKEMNEKLARLCLVSVGRLPSPSWLMHFGDVSETKTRSDRVTGRVRQGSPSLLAETSFLNREEKSLCHVVMVAKFLYDNKPKTSVKKWIRTVSNVTDLNKFHLICQMLANFLGLNLKGPFLKKILGWVHALHSLRTFTRWGSFMSQSCNDG